MVNYKFYSASQRLCGVILITQQARYLRSQQKWAFDCSEPANDLQGSGWSANFLKTWLERGAGVYGSDADAVAHFEWGTSANVDEDFTIGGLDADLFTCTEETNFFDR